jgi:phosphatidylserine decarboxylase
MDDPSSVKYIRSFVNYFHIDLDEVLLPVSKFKSFNEFFYRKLKPEARLLSFPNDPSVVVSPADCRIVVFPTISEATRIWVKGVEFSVSELLKDNSMAQYFDGGSIVLCRLAPQDYHRFHSPVDGTMGIMIPIPGTYFTVNPMAVRQKIDVFTQNARTISYIYSDNFGKVAYVSVGATMVGSIRYTCKENQRLGRMDEVGYFAFGGSTIILLFAKDMITFDSDLIDTSKEQLETWIRCGDSIGIKKSISSDGSSSKALSLAASKSISDDLSVSTQAKG